MNIAVLADIHGFSLALDAVLADIDRQAVDQIVIAGDLCLVGPDPAGVIDRVKQRNIPCVYGNTDRDVCNDAFASNATISWVRDQIGVDGIEFLRSLPFSIRIPHPAGGGDASTDLLIVHANPTDVDRHLSPNASDSEVREILGNESAGTIAFGHLHVAYTRELEGTTLVDVSAVGNPRDGDLRPRYVVFSDRDDGIWDHRFRYVEYPLEATRNQMRDSGMPKWRKGFDRLVAARYNRSI